MAHHIKGQGRHQVTLLPEVLDDFVTEDNPAKVIDVFVDELQLDALGFDRVNAKQTGWPNSVCHDTAKIAWSATVFTFGCDMYQKDISSSLSNFRTACSFILPP